MGQGRYKWRSEAISQNIQVFTIQNITTSHRGVYTCIGTNKFGRENDSTELVVLCKLLIFLCKMLGTSLINHMF